MLDNHKGIFNKYFFYIGVIWVVCLYTANSSQFTKDCYTILRTFKQQKTTISTDIIILQKEDYLILF